MDTRREGDNNLGGLGMNIQLHNGLNIIAFFFYLSSLNNHHKAHFAVNKRHLNCNKQYFMFKQDKLFKYYDLAQQIIAETDPKKLKQLEKALIRNEQDREVWVKHKDVIKAEALAAKYSQDEFSRTDLLATYPTLCQWLIHTESMLLIQWLIHTGSTLRVHGPAHSSNANPGAVIRASPSFNQARTSTQGKSYDFSTLSRKRSKQNSHVLVDHVDHNSVLVLGDTVYIDPKECQMIQEPIPIGTFELIFDKAKLKLVATTEEMIMTSDYSPVNLVKTLEIITEIKRARDSDGTPVLETGES